jgi:tetratricopeptide (TPR) repeat protein
VVALPLTASRQSLHVATEKEAFTVPQPAARAAPGAPIAPSARWRSIAAGVLILLVGATTLWWAFSPASDGPPTRDGDAWQFFQQAESVVNGTPESFLAAVSLYDQALARDPDFAPALSGRAMNLAALEWTGSPLGRGLEGALQDAQRALALDPADPRAHVVLASMSAMRGDWSASQSSFRSAIKASTRDADHRARYAATLLLPTGQVREAVAESMQAQHQEPGSSFLATMLAFAEHARDNDPEAVRLADLAISRGGDPRQMAPVYASAAARRGQYQEAAGHVIKVLPPAVIDAGGAAALRLAYAALGDPTQQPAALAALRSLTSGPAWERVEPRTRQAVMYLFAAFGAMDDLYDEMNYLLRQGADTYPQIIAIGAMWSPQMRPFRQDRRFQGLVERLGLVDYWKQSGPPDGCTLSDSRLVCT